MKKFCLTLLTFLVTFLSANSAIKVTPTILELNANDAKGDYLTASIDVQGGSDEIIRFKIYPEYFKISQQGTMEIIENSTEADYLIKNVRFVPNEFTLQNGKSQKVRLTVSNLKSMPDGESRMVLFLEDVDAKEVFLPSGQKDVTTKLLVKTRVGIPVYVDKGRFIKSAHIENFDVVKQKDELQTALKLVSTGNSKVRYSGKAQIIKDKKLIGEYPVKNSVISANNALFAQNTIPLRELKENGVYTVRMILQYTDEKGRLKNLVKENKFTIDTQI